VSASFVQKRKTILNNLKGKFENAADILAKAGIDGKRRAETLSLNEWERLTAEVSNQK
jgi:16S rRNA A1518/A1519 N6-dimethyltransferase RsmA/KsgA/DIM1 with predicted DNA glycosylase/AP lyase activity